MQAPSTEFKSLLGQLKQLLRRKKLTYKELAQRMNLSESALKRFFTGDDGSMGRVLEICQILEVDLADVLEEARKLEYTKVEFSLEQQRYLTERQEHLAAYWHLTAQEESKEEVRKRLHLSDKQMVSILKKLDQLQLIQWLPGDRIKTPKLGAMLWVGEGPLIDLVINDWSVNVVRRAAAKVRSDESYYLSVRTLKMLPETYKELRERLTETLREIEKKSNRDCALYPDQVEEMCLTLATVPEPML